MANGKKSFIAYSDWKDVFDELPNEDAGKLIKHIFAYVNDENPVSDSILINAVFANIKSTLKRDLNKWESQLEQRSLAGKRSAEIRALNKSNEIQRNSTTVNSRQRNSTVSVNDSVNVNVIVNDNVKEVNNNIDTRKINFSHTLQPFLEVYGKDILNDFYKYWTEPNKSNTKFRMELQKTWSVEHRLETWAKNDKNFNKTNNGITSQSKPTASQQLENLKSDFNRRLDQAFEDVEY